MELRNRVIAPDVPLPSCMDRSTRYPVARHVGRMLRIGGEVGLCFTCGPDGGVYHPMDTSMETVRAVAERIFLHDGDGSEPPTAGELLSFEQEMRRRLGLA